jgi:hypothetical protein
VIGSAGREAAAVAVALAIVVVVISAKINIIVRHITGIGKLASSAEAVGASDVATVQSANIFTPGRTRSRNPKSSNICA